MFTSVNVISVIVAAVLSMGIGFLWYSPLLFANPWMELMGIKANDLKKMQKQMGPMYGLSFLGALVMSYVLAQLVYYLNPSSLLAGFQLGFVVWLGFIGPVQMTDCIFGVKKWKLFYLNTGYQLASVLAMGALLTLWR